MTQYNVIYDASSGLQYLFETGAISVPLVLPTVQVIAGTGLSGGGVLSGNVTVSLSSTTLGELFTPVATDPSSPVEGQVWYNTTTHAWKGYNGTATKTFTVS